MKRGKFAGYGVIGLLLLVVTLLLCIGIGSVYVPAGEIAAILLHRLPGLDRLITPDWTTAAEQIVVQVRLPRVLLGMLVGASLAVAGAGFQGCCATRWRIRLHWAYRQVRQSVRRC